MEERTLADIRFGLLSDASALSNTELLALVIGAADRKRSSLKNAARLLDTFGSLERLTESAGEPGFFERLEMGQVPGSRVLAVAEIIRRCSGRPAANKAEGLALAYLSTAAETLDGLSDNPSPALIRQGAELMRHWHEFASRLL